MGYVARMGAEPRRDAATRLGAPPPPPPPGTWRPILRRINDRRDAGAKALHQREAKAAIRMYRLLCDLVRTFAVGTDLIEVFAWADSRASDLFRVTLSLHWCREISCERCDYALIDGGYETNLAVADTDAFIGAVVRITTTEARDELLQEPTPLMSHSMKAYPDSDRMIIWPGLSPRQLTAKRAAKLDPTHAHP